MFNILCSMKNYKIQSFVILILLINLQLSSCLTYWNERHLDAGDVVTCCDSPPSSRDREQPQIYCYDGRKKHPVHLFETVLLEISLPPEQYALYEGSNVEEVLMEFDSHRSLWNMNFFTWKRKDVRLNPFNNTCIGLVTNHNYEVELNVLRVDYWRVIAFACGMVLFFLGPRLSKNILFYYICGVSFGVFASFLILIYFMSRLFPKRPIMYGFVIGGWAIGLYVIQMIWDNIQLLSQAYRKYVIGYFVMTAAISFIICYRLGPVTDPRSKNIIKWTLQGVGLATVLFCSYFQEATLAVDIVLLLSYNFPASWVGGFKRIYNTYFNRPKPRLLTEDEYYEEGVKETAKALEELRGFCSSPNCNQWKTVLNLSDAKRFANFVQGESHLTDDEILAFETENGKHLMLCDDNFTDDSDG